MIICTIYKSPLKDEMYLYVDKKDELKKVPEALIQMFGTPSHLMDMPMLPGRKLARVDVEKMLEGIKAQGFYLQMPPPKEDYMLDLYPNRPETGVR
ncbi:YcgL domain-containing protein [Neptunomonas sp.]|uniref:YcgL domain-containing protein n=1 Tax=Neptunomonas sp. TaxID=1971898 RepID=UPI0025D6C2BC|nr:YcgL domain-containing protein [Neptunomonas sp.]